MMQTLCFLVKSSVGKCVGKTKADRPRPWAGRKVTCYMCKKTHIRPAAKINCTMRIAGIPI